MLNPYATWCKVKDLTHSHLHPPASRCMFAEHTLDANADETIKRYIEHQEHRKADLVVYTCITNDYDNIHEISAHRYVNLDADYVCFSDNDTLVKQRRVGIWQIRPLQFRELDSTRNNRWHKFMPHMLFPEYKRSIYIDANIDILTPWLFEEFEKRQIPFMLPRHGWRDCVYNEYDTVISLFLDDLNRVKDELKLIRKAKMPKKFGHTENNILCRDHHNQQIIKIMDEWWDMVVTYSRRDQLSLCYLLWKHGFKLSEMTFTNARVDTDDFCVFRHSKAK